MEIPIFILKRYNPRRAARGAEAAELEVTWPDGDKETLWMSKRDIAANAKDYGWQGGLQAAHNAYRTNQNFPANA